MEKYKVARFGLVAFAAVFIYLLLSCISAVRFIDSIPSGITVTPYAVENGTFGAVDCKLNISENAESGRNGKLSFKLFGVLPIKTIDIICAKDKQVRLGGFPVGLVLEIDGVLVDEIGFVNTAIGKVSVGSKIEAGDIILGINEAKITNSSELISFMDKFKGDEKLKITVNRKGLIYQTEVSPLIDELSGKYKLGLWVRDKISGVGTTGFIRSDNSFASLGHGIAVDDYVVPITGGEVFNCDIVGVNRGSKGAPGELKGVLKDTDNPIGSVDKNSDFGVYGKFDSDVDLPEKYYHIGSRLNVRNGKAKIYTTVDGKADFYDVEIIRAMPQSERADRSMVIRVTDKRLLDISGGIVRGMSGSPIIQNDMVVGALTHVFINDPTKGYGLYMDWMY